MNKDLLERAESAWRAGSDEVHQASQLPIPNQEPDHQGTLLISDAFVARHDLDSPTEELAKKLGVLRDGIATAKDANSVQLGVAEVGIEAQLESVEAHTRELRALRTNYEARWGRASKQGEI